MEAVGHRRHPLAGSGVNVAPFLASRDGATSRQRRARDKAAIAKHQEQRKLNKNKVQ
jgi:hypothetical protein